MIIGELTETYPPEFDGVGRVALAYCQALERAGHTAYYIAPGSEDDSTHSELNTLLYNGIRIPRQNYRLGLPEISFSCMRKLMHIDFDLLHIHTPFLSGKIALRIAHKKHIPVIATFHSKYYDDFYKATHNRFIANQAVRILVNTYNRCDAVYTVNNETAKVLRSYGFQGRIGILPNGTDIIPVREDLKDAVRKKYGICENDLFLLFVGQVDMKKNIQTTVKACSILKKKNIPFKETLNNTSDISVSVS